MGSSVGSVALWLLLPVKPLSCGSAPSLWASFTSGAAVQKSYKWICWQLQLDFNEPMRSGGGWWGGSCIHSVVASSFSNVSHSYWTGNKQGVSFLSFPLGSRIMKEENSVSWKITKSFRANALNEKEVAHKRASGVKCDRKAKYFFLVPYDHYTHHSKCCCLWKRNPTSPTGTSWCDWSLFLAWFDEENPGNSLLEIVREQQQLQHFLGVNFLYIFFKFKICFKRWES